MGNTNKRGSLGDKVGHFFKDTIGGGLKKAWNYVTNGIKGLVSTVHDDVKGIANTVHDDVKGLVTGVGTLVEKTEDNLTGAVKEVARDAKDLGSNVAHDVGNMAMPLAIGAAAIAAVMLMSKR